MASNNTNYFNNHSNHRRFNYRLDKHPCIAQKGSCRYGNNCDFAAVRADACLQHLRHGSCRFGNNCKYIHIDQRSRAHIHRSSNNRTRSTNAYNENPHNNTPVNPIANVNNRSSHLTRFRRGIIVSFNKQKKFGFISTQDNFDIFVHHSDVKFQDFGHRILTPGQSVEFQIATQADGRQKAVNVTGPNGAYIDGSASQQLVKIYTAYKLFFY